MALRTFALVGEILNVRSDVSLMQNHDNMAKAIRLKSFCIKPFGDILTLFSCLTRYCLIFPILCFFLEICYVVCFGKPELGMSSSVHAWPTEGDYGPAHLAARPQFSLMTGHNQLLSLIYVMTGHCSVFSSFLLLFYMTCLFIFSQITIRS